MNAKDVSRSTEVRAGQACLPPILFVLLQSDAAANGGISSISGVIAGLKRHRPVIITDRDGTRVEEWRRSGIETHVLPQTASKGVTRNPIGTLRSYWRYARELRRLIRTSGAKIVHANDPLALQLSLAAAKLAGAKLVFNLRDTLDPGRRPPRSRYRFLFGAADHVFYLSRDMADRWAEVAPNAKSACSATYSVVDPDIFAPVQAYLGEGPPVALLSGLIWAKKGQLDFIRHVSPKLASEGIATWLASDFDPNRSPYMAACAEAAAPLGSMVEFLGYRTDIPQLMARSTVVAVASRHEGLVRAMIEAMSCGRPVVSFDISSAREILQQESGGAGVVVESGDFEAMADSIIRYCHEPELAAVAGERGRATAARLFAPETVVNRYERVYDMLESGA
jgi:glycosyltransferase involved in cell wall biosynthesis